MDQKHLKAQVYVEKTGTEYLSDLMTRCFIEGYDQNNEIILLLISKTLKKDLPDSVIWYNSLSKELGQVPCKMNHDELLNYLLNNKVPESVIFQKQQELAVQMKTWITEPNIESQSFFSKILNFLKRV